MVSAYVWLIQKGVRTIDDVPANLRGPVLAALGVLEGGARYGNGLCHADHQAAPYL